MDQELTIVFDETDQAAKAIADGNQIGECEFEVEEKRWIITHTGVRPEFGGRGIARMLVNKVVEEARLRKIKILPLCSYAKKVLTENKEYEDVLE